MVDEPVMSSSSSPNQWPDKDTGVLTKQKSTINSILDRLDAADSSKYRNRRRASRIPYRRLDLPARIFHPGGTVAFKTVATRNLSATGMGFLYTGFLHLGTRVELMVNRLAGGEDLIAGTVIFCGHVTGTFHQVGVRFERKISPNVYVDRETLERHEGAGLPPTTLGGNVLHVDESEVERKLMAHYLKPTKVTLTSVATADLAVAAVRAAAFDLVLCEINQASMPGEKLLAALRDAGYAGRFIVVTSETSVERLRAVRQAGATGMLSKPYDFSRLQKLIGPFLKHVAADALVTSTLASQPTMQSLIERYVVSVHKLAGDIEKAAGENQLDRIRQICTSLRGSGAGYGFGVLAESAKDTIQCLDASNSVQASNEQIRKLLDLCRRVIAR